MLHDPSGNRSQQTEQRPEERKALTVSKHANEQVALMLFRQTEKRVPSLQTSDRMPCCLPPHEGQERCSQDGENPEEGGESKPLLQSIEGPKSRKRWTPEVGNPGIKDGCHSLATPACSYLSDELAQRRRRHRVWLDDRLGAIHTHARGFWTGEERTGDWAQWQVLRIVWRTPQPREHHCVDPPTPAQEERQGKHDVTFKFGLVWWNLRGFEQLPVQKGSEWAKFEQEQPVGRSEYWRHPASSYRDYYWK